MYNSISVDHSRMAAHLTRSDGEVFCEVLYIQWNAWD